MVDKKELKKRFTAEWQKHYKIDFLLRKGFMRKQCRKCGNFFWTLDSERTHCADSSCVGYGFIGKGTKFLSYTETWDKIEKYFTKNGHTSIPRYPTVCRWRDDLYFTNASIIDFQPYVVSGEMEPPANPLIVPQASIRFGDIENVGVTGQHYSSFIMFGQHAFNSPKTGLFYWKDQALEHDFNYVTKVLGVKPEEFCFQEEVWAGGGTFGPCIEYCVDGVELGNCVFMQFKELPFGKFEQLKTKVIDMGAGLERLAWFTNGTPTSYDVTFGPVIKKMISNAGLKIDKKLFLQYAKVSGILDVDTQNVREERKVIAKKLCVSEEELFSMLRPLQALYACADHLKTILYAVSDGMLPSNSGGGYNLRMLLRRVFGFNKEFNLHLDVADILFQHGKFLENFDRTLLEAVPTAVEVVEEERKKFSSTVEKSRKIVESLVLKAKSGEEITAHKLTQLYESHGVPVELIEEEARKANIAIMVPENFYVSLAKKNEREIDRVKSEIDLSKFPKTIDLFYEEPYSLEFTSKVLGKIDKAIILNKTLFYAESGGQEADHGLLNDVIVEDVQKKEGVFLHYVSVPEKFKLGAKVVGKIDWNRRHNLMRHHTATHLLNASCREVLGTHVWQAGAHKKENLAHLDITHFKKTTDEELQEIEMLVNKRIQENLPVKMFSLARNKAEEKYGFRLYQGGYVPGKELRIVEVVGIDVEACGGVHVAHTGEIGFFKILKKESIQDGVERITFAVGLPALEFVQKQEMLLSQTAETLSVPVTEIANAAQKFFDEWKEQRKKIESFGKQAAQSDFEELMQCKEKILKKYFENADCNALFAFGRKLIEEKKDAVAFLGASDELIILAGKDSGKNAEQELKKVLGKLMGSGGGSQFVARAKIFDKIVLKIFLEKKE